MDSRSSISSEKFQGGENKPMQYTVDSGHANTHWFTQSRTKLHFAIANAQLRRFMYARISKPVDQHGPQEGHSEILQ